MFYCVDTKTGKRTSLQTANEDEARQLMESRNNADRQPAMNLQIAQVYLQHGNPRCRPALGRTSWTKSSPPIFRTCTMRVEENKDKTETAVMFFRRANLSPEIVDLAGEIRHLLKLPDDQQQFCLIYSPVLGTTNELAVGSHSLVQIMEAILPAASNGARNIAVNTPVVKQATPPTTRSARCRLTSTNASRSMCLASGIASRIQRLARTSFNPSRMISAWSSAWPCISEPKNPSALFIEKCQQKCQQTSFGGG